MLPHSGLGGCMPSPIKLIPAAVRIAPAIPSVTWTITGATQLGRICFIMIFVLDVPDALHWNDNQYEEVRRAPTDCMILTMVIKRIGRTMDRSKDGIP